MLAATTELSVGSSSSGSNSQAKSSFSPKSSTTGSRARSLAGTPVPNDCVGDGFWPSPSKGVGGACGVASAGGGVLILEAGEAGWGGSCPWPSEGAGACGVASGGGGLLILGAGGVGSGGFCPWPSEGVAKGCGVASTGDGVSGAGAAGSGVVGTFSLGN